MEESVKGQIVHVAPVSELSFRNKQIAMMIAMGIGNKEIAGEFDTRQLYEIFGGEGVWTEPDARETSPAGNYKSGTLLASRAFAQNPRYDNSWYTFGPFNPAQGEYVEMYKGRIFKIICDRIDISHSSSKSDISSFITFTYII